MREVFVCCTYIIIDRGQFQPFADGRDTHTSGRSYRSRLPWQIGNGFYLGSTPVISDHSLITIQLPICRTPPISFYVTTWPWKREAFSRELMGSILCSSEDAWNEMSVEAYSSVLTWLVDRLALRIVVRKHFCAMTPWFNAICRAEKRSSRCFERVYIRTRLAQDRSNWINQLWSSQLVYQWVQHEFWQTLITHSSGICQEAVEFTVFGDG